MLQCVSVDYFFLLLNSFPLYRHIILCFSIYWLMDICSFSFDSYAAMNIHVRVIVWTYMESSGLGSV